MVNCFVRGYERVAVFYGNSKIASCSPMKGNRLPQQALYNAFQRNEKVDVYNVDEYKSTKLCSKCFGELTTKKARKRYRRMVCHTEDCRTVWHRDVNAGRNMVMLGLSEHFGHPKPEEYSRTRVVSLFNVYYSIEL